MKDPRLPEGWTQDKIEERYDFIREREEEEKIVEVDDHVPIDFDDGYGS